MKLFIVVVLLFSNVSFMELAQADEYGQPNPEAPSALQQFKPLIGLWQCESISRIDQDNWAAPVSMSWTFKYIMDGWAVQDDTLKADGKHSGSIRQYDIQNKQWLVHYFSSQATPNPLPTWTGGLEGTDWVFWRELKAPNGMAGSYRLTFSDITDTAFAWQGVWVSEDKSVEYPTWKINCLKAIEE